MTAHTLPTEPGSSILLLGLMSGRPHAARFSADENELARKAASLMGLNVICLDEPRKAEAAKSIPEGRVFKTGRAFAPFCKATTYRELCALGGIDPDQQLSSTLIPVDRLPTDAGEASAETFRLPIGWDDLGPGCLCLATEGPGHGWYPVEVLEVAAEGLIVRWRDFDEAEWGRFTRHPDQLALLPLKASTASFSAN